MPEEAAIPDDSILEQLLDLEEYRALAPFLQMDDRICFLNVGNTLFKIVAVDETGISVSHANDSWQDDRRYSLDEAAHALQVHRANRSLVETLKARREEASKDHRPEEITKTDATLPPVFFVDWETAQHDFDLSRYKDRDIVGYDKNGVQYAVGRSGSLSYVTSTGMLWGGNSVPGDIYERINAYRDGSLTDEQVRENYLKVISPQDETAQETAAHDTEAVTADAPAILPEPAPTVVAEPQARVNFRISDEHLGEGGAKTKYGFNIAAIRTLKQIEAENDQTDSARLATPAEQEVLSRYVGWGGIPQVFSPEHSDWTKEYAELRALLSTEEYESARATVLNAHYTSPTVIEAMFEPIVRAGFSKGNVLEPAMGVGNFYGLLPESMKQAKLYGCELDSITGRIAQKLYPQANITISGYEKTSMPDNFFDLAIGNVPFGGYKVADHRYDKHNFLIHDYFFGKTLDQVRPGGIIAFISSHGTLDKQNSKVRKYIAQRAELLGAVRLPNDAFKKNAGTEVTTDIIFLQKRDRLIDIEPEWIHVAQNEDGVPMNQYFLDHPEMVLGKMSFDKSMYGSEKDTTCHAIDGVDLQTQLTQAMANIVIPEPPVLEMDDLLVLDGEERSTREPIPADPSVRNFSYAEVDGELYYRENSFMQPVDLPEATEERVRGMLALRDTTRELLTAQLENRSDDEIARLQSSLNEKYDAFSKRHGLINSMGNKRAFQQDSSYALLCSLEHLDDEGNLKAKAAIFSKRTIRPAEPVTHVDTASEALAVSIGERASIDLPFMADLSGLSEEKIIEDLQGVIFKNPARGDEPYAGWESADEYLSGNVREKLQSAMAAAEKDPAYAPNVRALENIQPKDLTASEIDVRLGVEWVDRHYYQQFMEELLQTPENRNITIHYSPASNNWFISNKTSIRSDDVLANINFGSKRRSAYQLLEDALNQKSTRVYDIKMVDGKESRELNFAATEAAQEKQNLIKEAFKDWLFKDPMRREALCRKYNETFNNLRPREYNGEHIQCVGMNPEISLREHQKNAIARMLYGGNSLLAHCVGAGKTFEMVAASMESKRLGLCQKSLFVVPNHLTEQWASEFYMLYPNANVLVATKKDFEPGNRKKFCARIATGDYDAVIIGHSQFERIPVSAARQQRMIEQQIGEISDAISMTKEDNGERYTIKQMEKTKKSLESKLEKLSAEHKKDDVVTFEELGVDRLFVDEAHGFKNLFLYTKMRNVAGISQTEAQKSSDMFMKCRYMDELTGGKGVVFATGTPISNSMTELYTMMRYLQYDTLERLNLSFFDNWAVQFGETVTELELKPEGTGLRPKERFSRFFNLPELITLWKEAADIKTADMLDLDVPEAEYITEVTKASTVQKEIVSSLADRAEDVRNRKVDPWVDNMLKITSDGRKLALDQRLYNDMLPDDPGGKINKVVSNVVDVWRESADSKGTQLIFCDISTPKKQSIVQRIGDGIGDALRKAKAFLSGQEAPEAAMPFNAYDDIKAKLMAQGVPEKEIAFIHDANTEKQKAQLFAKVRSGAVRVLIGSTAKMGAGTNAQDRLVALHHTDCPWRPSDIEQREGRIIRQGNRNKHVKIFRYVTEGTFDSYNWALVERKQKFISQIMTSKSPVRSFEDNDETALSYAEVKALASGDPRIMEKMNLDIEVTRLKTRKANHQGQQYELEDKLTIRFPARLKNAEQSLAAIKADLERLAQSSSRGEEGFHGMELAGTFYAKKADAGKALLQQCQHTDVDKEKSIGSYRGFDLSLSFNAFANVFVLTLQGDKSYPLELGKDPHGNITRINNLLDKLPEKVNDIAKEMTSIQEQTQQARLELGKPFPQEQELNEKMKRLNTLNVALSKNDAVKGKEADKPSLTERLKALLPAESGNHKNHDSQSRNTLAR